MNIVHKVKSKLGLNKKQEDGFRSSKQISYSQTGEDLIVRFILGQLNITQPKYLDLGAHHPDFLNNTNIFYQNGGSGVNVEPDPFLIQQFDKLRPNDINLNVGIGFRENEELMDFFVMSDKVLNTFSKEEAEKIESYGTYKIEQVLQIKLIPISKVLSYFKAGLPNFVTLDVEGLDLQIIKTIDFESFRPQVFCIETITYTEDKSERKITEIIDWMLSKDYFVYADTFINTIFVDKQAWLKR